MMRGSWFAASLMGAAGLGEDGEAEALDAGHAGGGVGVPLARGDQLPLAHVDAGGCQDGLGEVLVHGDGGGGHAAAHVAHAGHLEEALDGAVLAVAAMQEREHEVHVAEVLHADDARVRGIRVALVGELNEVALARGQGDAGRPGGDGLALPVLEFQRRRVIGDAHPLAVARNAQRDHIPLGAVDSGQDAGGRRARDLMLGGASTEDDEDARTRNCSHGSKTTAREAFHARVRGV